MRQLPEWLAKFPDQEREAFLLALDAGTEAARVAAMRLTERGAPDPSFPGDYAHIAPLQQALHTAAEEFAKARDLLFSTSVVQGIRDETYQLRFSEDEFWTQLRTLLQERGLDILRTAYVDGFPDDVDLHTATVVTYDATALLPVRTFYFEVTWPDPARFEGGVITEWEELTPQSAERSYTARYAMACSLVLNP